MVEVGDLVRYNSQWIPEGAEERVPRRIDKIVKDVDTGVKYAYLVHTRAAPETDLVALDELDKKYEVVEDDR